MNINDKNVVHAKSKISNQPTAFNSSYEYDSGWHSADNKIHQNLRFTHNLGFSPSMISIFFSPDQETSYPLLWPHSPHGTGDPLSIWVTSTVIVLGISNDVPLHGAYDGQSNLWTQWTSGYFRVFASR
ncbi:hypothetical protein [Burkholderia ubonensis]|uniref:hypothetical protein n=1 Tax=Burkholderia ubonensis TaxID=101571 RepID=UPI0009B3AEE5|nr:hypothetical protein [Burkholderia ubonensis]